MTGNTIGARGRLGRWHFLAIAWLVSPFAYAQPAAVLNIASGDSPPASDRLEADRQFIAEIKQVLEFCRAHELVAERELTLRTYIERDPQRQYIFFASDDNDRWQRPEFVSSNPDWIRQIRAATTDYASHLYELALTRAAAGHGADAFQLVHEVLHWDPGHAEARRILGHRRAGEGWQVVSERLRKQRPNRPHPQLAWPAGTYWQMTTDHFDIVSMADEETTLQLAEHLQRCQLVWRQVFFDYWGNAGMLQNWIAGTTRPSPPTKRHKIVFFSDRQQYLQTLRDSVPGVEASTGYYHDRLQTSFFYADSDPTIFEVWRHELTHQLFQESIRARLGAFEGNSLWLGEGIAMYMESLRDFGAFATLGGWDASRLQYARMRRWRLGQHVPLAELSAMTQQQFQQRPDLRQLYSQASGLCHYLMVGEHGQLRGNTVELLSAVYRGRIQPAAVEKALQRTFEELDDGFARFLRVKADDVRQWLLNSEQLSALSLAESELNDDDWDVLAQCRRLLWLDLSGHTVTERCAIAVTNAERLQELYLNRCRIDDAALPHLLALPNLKVLDMTEVRLSDDGWRLLRAWQRARTDVTVLGAT